MCRRDAYELHCFCPASHPAPNRSLLEATRHTPLLRPFFALGIGLWISGLELVHSHTWSKDGVPTGMYFFMGSVMLLAAAGDIRMLVRGGVFGAKRIVRHLWRMCFGFFIATGSFFLGQQQVFPAWLRGSSVLFIPALLPLVLLIFWLFRVRFTNAYKRMSMPRGGDVNSLRTEPSRSLHRKKCRG